MFHVIDRRTWQRMILMAILLGTSVGMLVMYDEDVEPVIGHHLRLVGQLLGTGDGFAGAGQRPEVREPLDTPTAAQDALQTETAAEQAAFAPTSPGGNSPGETASDVTNGDARLAVYRLERDRNLARYIEQLQDLVAVWGDKSDPVVQAEIVKLLGRAERQMQAEGLLRVHGMNDAVVVLADAEAIVVVGRELSVAEVSHIGSLVSRVAGIPLEHITISDGLSYPQ